MKNIAFILFLCLFTALNAAPRPTQDDFNICFEKSLKSMVDVNGAWGVALSPNLVVVPKQGQMPIKEYLKFDPFLGLYLVTPNNNKDQKKCRH